MLKGGRPLSRRRGHLWPSRCLSFPGPVRQASQERGQLRALMSLKVTGCSEWELWAAGLTGEGRGSGCLGWVRGSLRTVGIWGQSWGGCAELAETPALAQGSKQATHDVWAQLCGGELDSRGSGPEGRGCVSPLRAQTMAVPLP